MKKYLFIFCALFAMFVCGCQKEDDITDNKIILQAEGFTSSTKASVEGKYTYWLENDNVLINGTNYQVHIENNGNDAMISEITTTPNHTYYCVYPSSVYVSNSGSIYTVNIPKRYQYKESSGRQVLDKLPMVSYYTGNTDPRYLHFKHLTAALTIRIKNEREESIEIDKVAVINNKYKLSGNTQVDISTCSDATGIMITPVKTNVPDTVYVYFSGITKHIGTNEYLDIQVPIFPVGNDNSDFTINVYGHNAGTRYTYSRSTGERDNSIARACLGYVVTKYTTTTPPEELFDSHIENGRKYFEIWTPDDLFRVTEALANLWETPNGEAYNTANYMVMQDIDMGGATITPLYNYNAGGTDRCYFDGQDYTISNLKISSVDGSEKNACAFFGKSIGDNITVSNLNLEDIDYEVAHTTNYLIGYDNNPSTAVGGIFSVVNTDGIVIDNCSVSIANVRATNAPTGAGSQTDLYVGGMVALLHTDVTITNCSVGEVLVDNSNDVSGGRLVMQFGGAIGRIDVGDKNGSNSYQYLGNNAPAATIENFTYNQGSNPIVFQEGLKNVRYGGLIANITRGGIIIMNNCNVVHNMKVYKPTSQMNCAGLIGSNRVAQNMGIYLDPNCSISGVIDNQAVTSYNGNFQIEKYVGNTTNKITLLNGSASTCNYSLTVTGKTSGFKTPNQQL